MGGTWLRVRWRAVPTRPALGASLAVLAAVPVSAAAGCGADRPTGSGASAGVHTPPAPAGSPAPGAPARLGGNVDPLHDITDLSPSTHGLRLAEPVNGIRHGELVLTIRNNGPAPVLRLMFTVELPESMSADGGDWAGCTPLASTKPGFPAGSKCEKGYLGVAQSRSFRLGLRSPAALDGADSKISRWLTDVWSAGKRDEYCQDAAPEDNRKIFSVYRD